MGLRRAIVVMAKEPRPGQVKTRLLPAVKPGVAAALYRAFLQDILDTVRSIAGVERFCFVHPPAAAAGLGELVGPGITVAPQQGADLSERMVAAFDALFRRGFGAVVLRNSDSPTLPGASMVEALDALEFGGADCVLGPDQGGGYYLVGLRQARPDLFRGVAMSTSSVFDETARRARLDKLRLHLLPSWLDVNTPDDLDALRRELDPAWRGPRAACERTEAMVATLASLPKELPARAPQQRFPEGADPAGDEGEGRTGGPAAVP